MKERDASRREKTVPAAAVSRLNLPPHGNGAHTHTRVHMYTDGVSLSVCEDALANHAFETNRLVSAVSKFDRAP